jgi:hypothetical protein
MATALPPLSPLIWAWAQAVHADIQRWTFALSASVDEAIAVILLVSAWRPLARPLLLQFLALALVVDLAANIPFDPEVIVGYSLLLLLLVAYPEPRRPLTPSWRGPIDPPLLAMAVIVGAFFVPAVRAGAPGPGPGPGNRRAGPELRLGEHRRAPVQPLADRAPRSLRLRARHPTAA